MVVIGRPPPKERSGARPKRSIGLCRGATHLRVHLERQPPGRAAPSAERRETGRGRFTSAPLLSLPERTSCEKPLFAG